MFPSFNHKRCISIVFQALQLWSWKEDLEGSKFDWRFCGNLPSVFIMHIANRRRCSSSNWQISNLPKSKLFLNLTIFPRSVCNLLLEFLPKKWGVPLMISFRPYCQHATRVTFLSQRRVKNLQYKLEHGWTHLRRDSADLGLIAGLNSDYKCAIQECVENPMPTPRWGHFCFVPCNRCLIALLCPLGCDSCFYLSL